MNTTGKFADVIFWTPDVFFWARGALWWALWVRVWSRLALRIWSAQLRMRLAWGSHGGHMGSSSDPAQQLWDVMW